VRRSMRSGHKTNSASSGGAVGRISAMWQSAVRTRMDPVPHPFTGLDASCSGEWCSAGGHTHLNLARLPIPPPLRVIASRDGRRPYHEDRAGGKGQVATDVREAGASGSAQPADHPAEVGQPMELRKDAIEVGARTTRRPAPPERRKVRLVAGGAAVSL
jgi:hypothetical protein